MNVRLSVAGTVIAALALTACGGASGGEGGEHGEPRSGGTLKFGLSFDPPCLDPHYTGTIMNYTVSRNVVDSLVYWEKDGSFSPWLAESWGISEDGLEYTFKLREGVTFSNGVAFDAQAVKDNYDFLLDPANATNVAGVIRSIAKTDVVDQHTVKLTLSQPDAGLLSSLASVRAGFIEPSKLHRKDELCKDVTEIVGTGPFVFEGYRAGQDVTLTRNADYAWPRESSTNDGAAYLDKLVFSFLPETSARTGALQSDQVDVIDSVQSYDVPVFAEDENFQHVVGYDTTTSFGLNLNTGWPGLEDVRVRKAIRDGFDGDAIVTSLYQGARDRAWSWIGADSIHYDDSIAKTWGNDVDGANKLLDGAGWTTRDKQGYRTKDGKRLSVPVEYLAEAVRDQRDVLIQSVAAELKKNVGVELVLNTPDSGTFYANLDNGEYGSYPNIWTRSDYGNTLTNYIVNWLYGYTGDKLPDVIEKYKEYGQRVTATADQKERTELLAEVQKEIVVEDALFVPLTSGAFQLAASADVVNVGFEPESLTVGSFQDVWLDR